MKKQSKERRIVNKISGNSKETRTAVGTDIFLPNQSGDHSAGQVVKTPVNDNDIANKKYVDDNAGGTEINDLTAAVTWANIPDTNVPESAVTQHEAAIDHDALANFSATEHFTKSSIAWTDMADGTDGQIPTFDSAGSAAFVSTGNADQILTSNGAGAAPTFQDAAGGSATKEFFVMVADQNLGTATFSIIDDYFVASLAATSEHTFNFFIPADFTSLTSAVLVCIPDATETVQWDTNASYAAAGQNRTTHTGSQTNATQAVTINIIAELDVSAALTSIAASDYVGLRFQSDTTVIRAIGLRIKYS